MYDDLPNGDLVVKALILVIEFPPLPFKAGFYFGGSTGLSLLALFMNAAWGGSSVWNVVGEDF